MTFSKNAFFKPEIKYVCLVKVRRIGNATFTNIFLSFVKYEKYEKLKLVLS